MLVGDCVPKALNGIYGPAGWWITPTFRCVCILIAVLVTCRNVLAKFLIGMKRLSVISLLLGLYVSLNIFALWFADERLIHQDKQGDAEWFIVSSRLFSVLPIYTIMFSFHQNVFQMYHELRPAGIKQVRRIIHVSMSICAAFYIIVGVCGYLTFHSKTLGNILNNYEPTITITILRIAVSVMASVGFPLQLHPCIPSLYAIILRMKLSARRIYLAFDHRIQLSVSSPTRSTISRLEDVDDELLSPTASRKVQTSQIDDSRDDDSMSEQEHRYTAIFGLFLSLSLAIAFVRLDEIYSVVGSLSGSLICLIFPAFFALRCLKMEKKDVLCSLLVAGSGSFIAITSLLSPYL